MTDQFNKYELSEDDVRSKFITPAIQKSGWNLYDLRGKGLVRENFLIRKGKIIIKGELSKREEEGRADYVLFYNSSVPLAVVEAKNFNNSSDTGLQQADDYAKAIDVPFVFSSNGEEFVFYDYTAKENIQTNLTLDQFPNVDKLWDKFKSWKKFDEVQSKAFSTDIYFDPKKQPRAYQSKAISRSVEQVIKKKKRILLVMATGTGKTYTMFNIIWKLWKSNLKKRILFLTDRNFLIDQTKINDFKPFGRAMTKITNRKIDKSYEIYLSLYQQLTGPNEKDKIYKNFSKDFFDLIVIDECHRGSANEDSEWREILNYFSSSTQIGMTATPKETKYVSNINYFGNPIFEYKLKDGINDGYSAPCKIWSVNVDKDKGWKVKKNLRDTKGRKLKKKRYSQIDHDSNIVLEKRRDLVAQKITEYLKNTDRFQKSIIFCEDQEHAGQMKKRLVNLNSDLARKNSKYIMKITGDDKEGKKQVDNFIDPKQKYPVIATTSRLLSTGADVRTCKLIVIDKNIGSLSEFKQIIGRGTRIDEEYDKFFYTIMDFRGAYNHFYDPDFDGDPTVIIGPTKRKKKINKPRPKNKREKQFIENLTTEIDEERIIYFDKNKPKTISLRKTVKDAVIKYYKNFDIFIEKWTSAEKKTIIINELRKQGIVFEELYKSIGKKYDIFDLICHIAFDRPIISRANRATKLKNKKFFARYSGDCKKVLENIINKYSEEGIENIESLEVLRVPPIDKYGSVFEIINKFGGREKYIQTIKEVSRELYN